MNPWHWDRAANPSGLAAFAQQDFARQLVPADSARRLPGPGLASAGEKARLIYEVFHRQRISYVHEPTTSYWGLQVIRPVDQVLARPNQATCVDVCVAYPQVRASTQVCVPIWSSWIPASARRAMRLSLCGSDGEWPESGARTRSTAYSTPRHRSFTTTGDFSMS